MEWIIGLPALGHTAEGGTVREWLKSVGDRVVHSEPVVVVESDKASLEIEAPADGILIEILIEPGTEVPTGTVLGKIGTVLTSAPPAGRSVPEEAVSAGQPASPLPHLANGNIIPPAPTGTQTARLRSMPLARRIAANNGLDIHSVVSGHSDGVIRKADVLTALSREPSPTAAAASLPAVSPAPTTVPAAPALVPAPPAPAPQTATASAAADRPAASGLSPMRRAIARRMTEAWRNQPMVTLFRSSDVTRFVEWRKRLDKAPGMTALLAAAMARVLSRHPQLNGTIEDDQLYTGPEVDLAVAVALDRGLMAPVIRSAHSRSVFDIGSELDTLVGRARKGMLQPAESEGATSSLSNLGNFGISSFTPLLTPPQIAVLGVGAVERVFRETETGFAFRSEIQLSLTFDHRAVDGADGARFLQDLDALLQAPGPLESPVETY